MGISLLMFGLSHEYFVKMLPQMYKVSFCYKMERRLCSKWLHFITCRFEKDCCLGGEQNSQKVKILSDRMMSIKLDFEVCCNECCQWFFPVDKIRAGGEEEILEEDG